MIRILLVDDDDHVRSALARFLSKAGYHVTQANGGEEALQRLADSGPFEGMLSDIRMPGMSGLDLLPKAIAHDPDMAIIMLTAVGEPASAIQCLRLGAADYLIKPVEVEELQHALQYALRKRELEVDRRELEQWLAREVAEKTQELEEQSLRVELLSLSILTALVDAIEPRHGERNHSVRVANLCAHVAAAMGLPPDDVEVVRLAARLHDLGRVALKDDELRRASLRGESAPAGASAPALAARILEPLHHHAPVIDVIRRQLDRWDEHGEAIPVGARILAVVNGYDEMTESDSAAITPVKPAEAMAVLRDQAGKVFDPAVLEALARVLGHRLH